MYSTIENFLTNFSFLTLFLSMIIYWIEISNVTLPSVVNKGPTIVLAGPNTSDSDNTAKISFAQYGMFISNISIFLLLLLRWKESGHFPLSNLYESLMFLSWTLTTIHIFLDYLVFWGPKRQRRLEVSQGLTWKVRPTKFTESELLSASGTLKGTGSLFQGAAPLRGLNATRSSASFTKPWVMNKSKLFIPLLLGSITSPSALLTNAFATFSLPKEMQEASPLVPALQSNWLMMHVTVMILSYGALILGSLLSVAFLVITGGKELSNLGPTAQKKNIANDMVSSTPTESNIGKDQEKTEIYNLAQTFDNLSYRILGIGFPFLTIGILSGAVWANEAWGSYWSWDPKETWALLTWLVFAIYLHTRLNKGWEGRKPALIATLGLISVWICYLGVNLLGEGLHSYGWFST